MIKSGSGINWIITNLTNATHSESIEISGNVKLFIEKRDNNCIRSFENNLTIYYEGYVLVQSGKGKRSAIDSISFIRELYLVYKDDFINHIKGIFVIIIIDGPVFSIFNDQLGIRKYFYYIKDRQFIISNSIREISGFIKCSPDKNAIGTYLLLNYFISDYTYYKEIKKSTPASGLAYSERIYFRTYWDFNSLLTDRDSTISYQKICDKLIEILEQYLRELNITKPFITLTGGLDSRLLLALFLKIGVRPDIISYGNPESGDVKTAKDIANKFNLEFNNPDLNISDVGRFNEVSSDIIRSGQTLASIYRSYRYLSIRQMRDDVDALFGGYMGGEIIRGLHYEKMIFSEGLNLLWKEGLNEDVLKKIFLKFHIDPEQFELDKIIEIISESNILPKEGNIKDSEFNIIFNIAIYLHHAQDINLYSTLGVQTFPLFMDIDYLKIVFLSSHSFLFRTNLTGNQFKRINIQDFHCNLIRLLNPKLARINFNYGYSANLYLKSKFLYVVKRAYLKKFGKKAVSGFKYGDWYKTFLIKKLQEGANSTMSTIFDMNKMIEILEKSNVGYSESDYLPYTKAVNLLLIEENSA